MTKEEQELVKHHFLSILEPTEVYTVTDFKKQADEIIKQIHDQNKLPIIVGGTYYYIESVLYDKLIKTESSDSEGEQLTLAKDGQNRINYTNEDLESVDKFFRNEIRTFSFDDVDPIKLHNLLRKVDEETANRLHPNDKRKVVRALQVYQKTSKKYSDLIKEQHSIVGDKSAGISGSLRFPNSLILNLNVDKDVLFERIDQRVDNMVKKGLIDELTKFFNVYNEITSKQEYNYLDQRKGIFQMIGFKEFNEYFYYLFKNELNGKKVTDKKLIDNQEIKDKLIKRGLSNLKIITKKYSKTQDNWLKNRILANLNKRATPPIFNLNANDLEKWIENVLEPSIEIVDRILIRQQSNLPEHLEQLKASEFKKDKNEKELRYCKYCDKSMVDDITWKKHNESANHANSKREWEMKEANKWINRIDLKLASKIGIILLAFSIIGYKISN